MGLVVHITGARPDIPKVAPAWDAPAPWDRRVDERMAKVFAASIDAKRRSEA